MPQLPEETSPEGQTGKAQKGTKDEIQLQFNPTDHSLLPAVEPWAHRTQGRGNPSAQQEHLSEPGVSPGASAAPIHHPPSPGLDKLTSSGAPGGMKHFQSVTSWGDSNSPGCSPGAAVLGGLFGSPGLVWQHNGLVWSRGLKKRGKQNKKKSKAATDFYYLHQHFTC